MRCVLTCQSVFLPLRKRLLVLKARKPIDILFRKPLDTRYWNRSLKHSTVLIILFIQKGNKMLNLLKISRSLSYYKVIVFAISAVIFISNCAMFQADARSVENLRVSTSSHQKSI